MYLNAANIGDKLWNAKNSTAANNSTAAHTSKPITKQSIEEYRKEAQKGYEQMGKMIADTVKNSADKKFAKETTFTERVMKTMQTGIDEADFGDVCTIEQYMNRRYPGYQGPGAVGKGNKIRRRL